MERYFTLAGSIVRVTGENLDFHEDLQSLDGFRVPVQDADIRMHFQPVGELPAPEGTQVFVDGGRQVFSCADGIVTYVGSVAEDLSYAYMRLLRHGDRIDVQVKQTAQPLRITSRHILTALEVEHRSLENQGFVLHASCINHQGSAIVFTAPSGTGKSTQADLWKTHRGAEIINGDRIMLQRQDEGFVIRGIPFSGSSGISENRVLPLRAVVYLHQAPENSVRYLRGAEAFRRVWEGCSVQVWNRTDMERCMELVMQLVTNVPVLELKCTPDAVAVETLEATLDQWR